MEKEILPEEEYGIQNSLNLNKSNHKHKQDGQYLGKAQPEITVRDSQSPSLAHLKRFKKNKDVEKLTGDEPKPKFKRKLSSSKEK